MRKLTMQTLLVLCFSLILTTHAAVFFSEGDGIVETPTVTNSGYDIDSPADLIKKIPKKLIIQFKPDTPNKAEKLSAIMADFTKKTGLSTQVARDINASAEEQNTLKLPFQVIEINEPDSQDKAISQTALNEIKAAHPEIEHFVEDPIVKTTATRLTGEALEYALNMWNYELIKLISPKDAKPEDKEKNAASFLKNIPGVFDPVHVAVIDTGFTEHSLIVDRILPGYDFHSRDDNPLDDVGRNHWHGLHVGGTISAIADLIEIPRNTLAEEVKLLNYRALGEGGFGSLSNIVLSMLHTTAQPVEGSDVTLPKEQRPRVVNMSLGVNVNAAVCHFLFEFAFTMLDDTLFLVAAGNDNADAELTSPANCSKDFDNVMTVASVTERGDRAAYSNFGRFVDIAAPGGEQSQETHDNISETLVTLTTAEFSESSANGDKKGVISLYNDTIALTSSDLPLNESTIALQGTSMATPHVAGVAAWLFAIDPELTPKEARDILTSTVTAFPEAELSEQQCQTASFEGKNCGVGILNAYEAVKKAFNRVVARR